MHLRGAEHRLKMGDYLVALPDATTTHLRGLGELAQPLPVSHGVDTPTAILCDASGIDELRVCRHVQPRNLGSTIDPCRSGLRGCALDALGFVSGWFAVVAMCCARPLVARLHEHLFDSRRRAGRVAADCWRPLPQHRVNRVPRPVVRIRPQVRVGVQRLRSRRMTQAGLHRLNRLPVPDEQACVVVPKRVQAAPWR